MTEHLSTQTVEDYRRHALAPSELLRADAHLAACETCRLRAAEGFQNGEALRALDASLRAEASRAGSEHLSFEQLADLVDGRLGAADREIAETHLELCRLCEEEAADLRSYQATLAASEARSRAAASRKHGFAWSLEALRRLLFFPTPLRAAAALALVLVTLLGVLVWRQSRPPLEVADGTRRQRTDEATRPSADAPTEPPSPSASDAQAVPAESPAAQTPADNNPAATQVAVVLDDAGGRITLDTQGNIEGIPQALSPAAREDLKTALAEGRVRTVPLPRELRGAAETLLGGTDDAESFSLVGPVGRVVRAARPRLSWRPLPGASRYTVTILDADLKPVAASPPLADTSWVVPRPLRRGRIYTWQVSALKDGQEIISPAAPAPPARFKVLEEGREEELRRLEREGARRSRLALGLLYARAGLLEESERELSALARANPRSDVARRLLESVRAARRRQK